MFEQYSYKQKFLALLVISGMLTIAAYKRSFKTLIEVVKDHKELTRKKEELNQKLQSLNSLEQEVNYLDNIIGKEGIEPQEVQKDMVSFISRAQNVSIFDLQPIHTADNNQYLISTNQVDVTGGVNSLLQLSYNFERDFNKSRMVSLHFFKSNKNNKKDVLHLKMIFQNYANNK